MFLLSLFQETRLKNVLLRSCLITKMVKNGASVYLYLLVAAAQNKYIREFKNGVSFSNTICLWVAAN